MVIDPTDAKQSRLMIALQRFKQLLSAFILVLSAYYAFSYGRTAWPPDPGDCAQLNEIAATKRSRLAKLELESRPRISDEVMNEIIQELKDNRIAQSEAELRKLTSPEKDELRQRIQERKAKEIEARKQQDAEFDERKSLELGVTPEAIAADRERYRSEDTFRKMLETNRNRNGLSEIDVARNSAREASYDANICTTRAESLFEDRAKSIGAILAILLVPMLTFLVGFATLARLGRWLFVVDKR